MSRFGPGVLLISAVLGLSGCSSGAGAAPSAPELSSGFSYAASNQGNRLRKACPRGVRCDAGFDYHALAYEDQRLEVTLFFDAELANGYSLDGFREYFQYARIQYEANTGSEPDARVLAETKAKRSDVGFRSYTKGTLHIVIEGNGFRRIVEQRSSDPGCRTGDIAGQCSDMSFVEAPYRITIKAGTPRSEPD